MWSRRALLLTRLNFFSSTRLSIRCDLVMQGDHVEHLFPDYHDKRSKLLVTKHIN